MGPVSAPHPGSPAWSRWKAASSQRPPDLPESILATGLRPLSIDPAHPIAARRLPPLHRDPFDRMLVARARVEGLTLATRDRLVQSYDVPVLKA